MGAPRRARSTPSSSTPLPSNYLPLARLYTLLPRRKLTYPLPVARISVMAAAYSGMCPCSVTHEGMIAPPRGVELARRVVSLACSVLIAPSLSHVVGLPRAAEVLIPLFCITSPDPQK